MYGSHTSTHTHTHTHTHTSAHAHTHTHTYKHTHSHIDFSSSLCPSLSLSVYIYICICTQTQTRARACSHIHTHTQTHTHTHTHLYVPCSQQFNNFATHPLAGPKHAYLLPLCVCVKGKKYREKKKETAQVRKRERQQGTEKKRESECTWFLCVATVFRPHIHVSTCTFVFLFWASSWVWYWLPQSALFLPLFTSRVAERVRLESLRMHCVVWTTHSNVFVVSISLYSSPQNRFKSTHPLTPKKHSKPNTETAQTWPSRSFSSRRPASVMSPSNVLVSWAVRVCFECVYHTFLVRRLERNPHVKSFRMHFLSLDREKIKCKRADKREQYNSYHPCAGQAWYRAKIGGCLPAMCKGRSTFVISPHFSPIYMNLCPYLSRQRMHEVLVGGSRFLYFIWMRPFTLLLCDSLLCALRSLGFGRGKIRVLYTTT